MTDLFKLILGVLASFFRSRAQLEAEILVLRQQINVLRRRASKRPHLNNTDRFLFVWLYRWFPSVLSAIAIVRPETIIRWHRAGFRAYWRRRSRNRVGRPEVSIELRTLIGEMSCANRLWGAPRIHGELLKLGFEVALSTVARYMCRRFGPPSQGWRTFLSNHADGIAAVDLFVLPTVAFQILYLNTSSGIGIGRMDRSSCDVCALWAFAIGRSPRDHPGKTLTLRDSLARSAGSAWTTSSCSVKRTCAGSSAPMLPTI
jgi:hypothetical protein